MRRETGLVDAYGRAVKVEPINKGDAVTVSNKRSPERLRAFYEAARRATPPNAVVKLP